MEKMDKRAAHEQRKKLAKEKKKAREARLCGAVEGKRYISERQFSAEQHTPIKLFVDTHPYPQMCGRQNVGSFSPGYIDWKTDWKSTKQHNWMPLHFRERKCKEFGHLDARHRSNRRELYQCVLSSPIWSGKHWHHWVPCKLTT